MGTLEIILALLPSVIRAAEALFSKEPKSGPKKKEEVKGAIHGFAKGMAAISTGGQKETWRGINSLMPMIDVAIDDTVTMMNKVGLLGYDEDR